MQNLQPFIFRDMRRGVIRKSAVSSLLAPENSVSHSMNINFDTILGSGVVRNGTSSFGTTVTIGVTPLGLAEFGTTPCAGVCAYSGASNGSIFYLDASNVLRVSGVTTLDNSAKVRFAVLGDRIFYANGKGAMQCSPDGKTYATTNCLTTIIPGVLLASKSVMLASGDPKYPSRVFFSSVIEPTTSPFITWDEHPTTGDWIDINPDDGDIITGFADTSTVTLVFKKRAMYRLDSISKTVSTKNIFNMGAVSQEAIVRCQGIVYFFTGKDIRRTDGGFPEQISRLGVQDFIDAIPYANWNNVSLGTDDLNVYVSIGDITIDTGKNEQESFKNIVLKFSPRDETWSIHSYGQEHRLYSQFTLSTGRKMVEADTTGSLQIMNIGGTDKTVPIFFDLRTQEIDFGNLAHKKTISDSIMVLTENGVNGSFGVSVDRTNFKYFPLTQSDTSVIDTNIDGNYFIFRWKGETSGSFPIFKGFQIEKITDNGIQ